MESVRRLWQGIPGIERTPNGRLLLVNHVNPTYTTRPKNWNVRNNLMAVFNEDDVLAGRPASPNARLKQLVTRASGACESRT